MSLRNIQDEPLFIQTVHLPAANASASTGWIDIGTGPHTDKLELRVTTDAATPNLVDAHAITITIEQSADAINNGGAIPELEPLRGRRRGRSRSRGGDPRSASPHRCSPLHPRHGRGGERGGDSTAVTFTLSVLE